VFDKRNLPLTPFLDELKHVNLTQEKLNIHEI
jgi:hypothetical protein